MKTNNLKSLKISSLAAIALVAATLPGVSMAHEYQYSSGRVLIQMLPLFDLHDGHHHRHHDEVRYVPVREKHHHGHHYYQHQPKRVVRSHEGYSDNKIIYKRFK